MINVNVLLGDNSDETTTTEQTSEEISKVCK